MGAYGYSPSSFKNLSTDPVRSKVVPALFKLKILLGNMSEDQIEAVFSYAKKLGPNPQNAEIVPLKNISTAASTVRKS
jgi:hypothetical protein